MDAEAGAFHIALAALHLAVVDADFHEGGGGHLGPMGPERDLVVAIAAARPGEGQVIEDALAETVIEVQPVRRREIDPRLPFLGAVVIKRLRRNPELHGCAPCLNGFFFVPALLPHFGTLVIGGPRMRALLVRAATLFSPPPWGRGWHGRAKRVRDG